MRRVPVKTTRPRRESVTRTRVVAEDWTLKAPFGRTSVQSNRVRAVLRHVIVAVAPGAPGSPFAPDVPTARTPRRARARARRPGGARRLGRALQDVVAGEIGDGRRRRR